jgi:hypothetical protein
MKSQVLLWGILFLLLTSFGGGCTGGQQEQKLVDEARVVSQEFMATLKQALTHGLGQGNAAGAIEICSRMAPAIADDISQRTGWRVARTSLKVRNPAHRPDTWESEVLSQFDARQAAGEDPAALEHHQILVVDGRRVFRYMQALPTGKLCLQCHGTELAPETVARLQELYPEDQATGYSEGDVRGAFTLSKNL